MPSERPVSLIQELRLRQWARRNYVAPELRRDADWHPLVLDEMQRRDQELLAECAAKRNVLLSDIVPLEETEPRHILRFDDHGATPQPNATALAPSRPFNAQRHAVAKN